MPDNFQIQSPSDTDPIQHRAFVNIGARQVHYRRIGQGPPALFIHSSPTNSSFVLPDMLAQADRHTCYAFDTPGFGLSDPLLIETMSVSAVADALAAAMDMIGLPPVPVFGTHSGAAIALELALRHPAKVTGIVCDGLPIFTPAEVQPLLAGYFAALVADPLGGHFASTWTRFRDQVRWFPWNQRDPEWLNEQDMLPPEGIHHWMDMFFAAAAHYRPVYIAVNLYGAQAALAVTALTSPALFISTPADMLHPHLERLPPLRDGQRIAEYRGVTGRYALVSDAFDAFGSPGTAPPVKQPVTGTDRISRQFLMDGDRPQMLRYLGDRVKPPLLLLHDAPGSGMLIEHQMGALAETHFVIAPDLPGSGESGPLGEADDLNLYAAAMWRMCDALGLREIAIHGKGFGASLAVEMAACAPDRCVALTIDGLLLPDAAERADMVARYTPPITIEWDGAHWYRGWQMLRDSLIYFPWYDTRRSALRRVDADFDAWELHGWTVDVMKQWASYHRFIQAALRHDAAARLGASKVIPVIAGSSGTAFAKAYGEKLSALIAA